MGNNSSSDKPGFYTPTAAASKTIPTVTPFNLDVNESEGQNSTKSPPALSPSVLSPPAFSPDISNMLSEIASEIDGDYKIHCHTINNTTTNLLDNVSFRDSASSTPIPMSPDYAKPHQYAHVSLDFVKKENYVSKISEIFTYQKQLGYGASCRVLLVTDNKAKLKKYALKEMQISDELNRLLFATEYKILNILRGHKNIISYHSSYVDKNCYYLSTTYCSGGTMLDRIIKQGHFNEKQHKMNGMK